MCVKGVCALYDRSIKNIEVNLESPGKTLIKLPSLVSLIAPLLSHFSGLHNACIPLVHLSTVFSSWQNEELQHSLWTGDCSP